MKSEWDQVWRMQLWNKVRGRLGDERPESEDHFVFGSLFLYAAVDMGHGAVVSL